MTDDERIVPLAENLQRYRKRKRLSQKQVAEALGLTDVTVSNHERAVTRPNDEMMAKYAVLYDIPEHVLRYAIGDDDPITKDLAMLERMKLTPQGRRHLELLETNDFDVPIDPPSQPAPRTTVNLPPLVREYLAELRLRMTRGGASDEEISEAEDLLRSPQLFTFYKGGAPSEYSDDDVLRGMKGIAESVIIPELNERGRKIT